MHIKFHRTKLNVISKKAKRALQQTCERALSSRRGVHTYNWTGYVSTRQRLIALQISGFKPTDVNAYVWTAFLLIYQIDHQRTWCFRSHHTAGRYILMPAKLSCWYPTTIARPGWTFVRFGLTWLYGSFVHMPSRHRPSVHLIKNIPVYNVSSTQVADSEPAKRMHAGRPQTISLCEERVHNII